MFTLDTESGFRDVVFLTASYGLGENVVQGAVDPDEFYVHKPTYRGRPPGGAAPPPRRQGDADGPRRPGVRRDQRDADTSDDDRQRFCHHRRRGARARGARRWPSSEHYGRPMDIEWAKDGVDGRLYIVQARPETVASRASATSSRATSCSRHGDVLVARPRGRRAGSPSGRRASSAAPSSCGSSGPARCWSPTTTTPDWEPVMKTAAAVVTDRGGRTCHAAIVARELGIPAVVGTGDGTVGSSRTAPSSPCRAPRARPAGSTPARPRCRVEEHRPRPTCARPRTKIMVNLGNPGAGVPHLAAAQRRRRAGADGVHHQRVHQGPPDGAAPPRARHRHRTSGPRSSALLRGYDDGATYFVAAARGGHRHHRRRVLPQAGRRPDVGLQDQRVRQPARRRRRSSRTRRTR